MVLLDSCFIIDLLDADPGAVEKLNEFAWTTASVSTLTVTEVGRGLTPTDQERFESIVSRIDVLPFGLEEARRATREHRRLRREGRQIGTVDLLIASTAIEANKTVVTRNVGEFRRTSASVTPY
ncbi:type II toxin-antitoxin system VapC family toxin [Natronobiforma cellulositropha]|uniref:type II toxin-antitoxin system VapC family toxin n=1 Tax=Natronobiforma cellulositropha TaxID=1679076 RepID=UPI0021D59C64|nr:type II toxin-antitoxin system VapC family toxin [Natronobiforma cellulositropha]